VVGRVAPGTAVTVEPGGQIELSGPPEAGVGPAVARLRYEGAGARLALAGRRFGLAYAGADPARPSRRVNPRPRYRAMEQHFAATGRAAAGRVMMNSTAALQVNLQAGPRREWPARVARAYRLGPTLVAIAASSPWLYGRNTGWKSVRQRAWSGLDTRTCGPVPGCAASHAGPRTTMRYDNSRELHLMREIRVVCRVQGLSGGFLPRKPRIHVTEPRVAASCESGLPCSFRPGPRVIKFCLVNPAIARRPRGAWWIIGCIQAIV
jgi:hypothetical protein